MSKSIIDIERELTLYQCCLADKAIDYIQKEIYGFQDASKCYNSFLYATLLLESLRNPTAVITNLEHLTQEEYEAELEKLNDYCGCINCGDMSFATNDTISANLTTLFIY